jgi:hypothetical protein
MINIDETYQKILGDLEQGHRGLVRFSVQDLEELEEKFKNYLAEKNFAQLEKVLCLIEHSSALNRRFEPTIMEALASALPDHLIIFSLNCARKHIIAARFQRGERLSFEFLEILKQNLYAPSPEIVEWTLRTIEECGNQGVYFLREFDKIKPPPWKWFNPHQRAVREIIALLERRWSRFEKDQPK